MWLPRAPRLRGCLADLPLTAALAVLTVLLACQELFDADTWWHLRAGRRIVEHRAFPGSTPSPTARWASPESTILAPQRGDGGASTWAVAEWVGATCLHEGEPAAARRTWLEAAGCPSEALRTARVADADLAAWDFAAAEAGYRRALDLDPGLADAWVGLALTARQAARNALKAQAPIEPRRRALLEGIEALCARHAP